MNVLFLMIPTSLLLGGFFVGAFIWSVRNGQMDDVQTPAHRILDNEKEKQ